MCFEKEFIFDNKIIRFFYPITLEKVLHQDTLPTHFKNNLKISTKIYRFLHLQRVFYPILDFVLSNLTTEGKMNFVSSILQVKGNDVFSVQKDTPLLEVLDLMAQKGIGAVLVMEKDKIAGIFSERDFARKVAKTHSLNLDIPISELMTKEVFVISPDETIDECMALMSSTRIRHLPVVEDGKLVGVISIGDVVRFTIDEKDLQIQSMEKYIFGYGYGQ